MYVFTLREAHRVNVRRRGLEYIRVGCGPEKLRRARSFKGFATQTLGDETDFFAIELPRKDQRVKPWKQQCFERLEIRLRKLTARVGPRNQRELAFQQHCRDDVQERDDRNPHSIREDQIQ